MSERGRLVTKAVNTSGGRAYGEFMTPRAVLLAGSVLAWIATIRWAHAMGNGPGTMGLSWAGFIGVWAVMMSAMMLPTVSREVPAAAQRHLVRTLGFGIGYISAWAAVGIVAFAAAAEAAHLVMHDPRVATGAAISACAVCSLYQFSPAKSRALNHCWPKPEAPSETAPDGTLRTVVQGVEQGGWCIASSWALMALVIAFGVMNIIAMVAIFLVTYLERRGFPRTAIRRVIGVASGVLAVVVLIHPELAAGLHVPATPVHV